LGNRVRFLSLIGQDMARTTLEKDRIPAEYVLDNLDNTAHSVILYDAAGHE
jgi:hypothetical protein